VRLRPWKGLCGEVHDLGLTLAKTSIARALPELRALGADGAFATPELVESVKTLARGKFAGHVPDDLARALWSRQNAAAIVAIGEIARRL